MSTSTYRGRLCMVVHAAYPHDVRVAREVRVARGEGWEVDVIALRESGEPKHEVIDGTRVFRLPFTHRRGAGVLGVLWEYFGFAALASLKVAALTVRHQYTLVQVHNPPDFLVVAAVLPRLLGARLILDIHDLSPDMFAMRFDGRRGGAFVDRILRHIERWATRLADVVVTVHEPYADELVARGVPRSKTMVVMNSLDDRLIPRTPRAPPVDRFRIVYHGTVTPSYGINLLVEAAAAVRNDIANLTVDVYGQGDALPEVQARAEELGVQRYFHLSGRYLPQAEVLERVQSAHVGVIPNLPMRLNKFALSSKMLEYVALGVPVVCADLPTIREHFSDQEVLFFRAGDSRSLARALRTVAEDPQGAAERARAALSRYDQDYRWGVHARRYAGVLNDLAESARERPTERVSVPYQPSKPQVPSASTGVREIRLEATHPIVFFDYFRVPYRRVRPDESWFAGLPGGHPLRSCGQVRVANAEQGPRSLYWPEFPESTDGDGRTQALRAYRLDSIPIFCRLVPDQTVAAWLGAAPSNWRRKTPILDANGRQMSAVWCDDNGNIFFPFDPSEVIVNFWSEAYQHATKRRFASGRLKDLSLRSYYFLRPAVPRTSQIRFRRILSRLQMRSNFPRWPIETSLNDVYTLLFRYVADLARSPIPWLSPWPQGYAWAFVLTHDVETEAGYRNLHVLRDLEVENGYRSSWNFVPMRYAVDERVIRDLNENGFEIGVHGLYHDGRDLASLDIFMKRLRHITHYAQLWNAAGFRSPATHRVWDWMSQLDFDYDSSYPDTDPFEPYPGGCCSLLPYFNQGLVELPITLPQDHTLFVILRHTDESLWLEKSSYLREQGAMALLITHPDYMLEPRLLAGYERLLRVVAGDSGAWRALPREVSAWWKRRAASHLEWAGGGWRIVGPAAGDGLIRFNPPTEQSTETVTAERSAVQTVAHSDEMRD